MSNVLSLDDIQGKKRKNGWVIEKLNSLGEWTKTPHLPKLAKAVAEECGYKQFQKMDYVYNGKCYEIVKDEEHIQNKVTGFLNGENLNYKFSTVTDVVKMMKAENTINSNSIERYACLQNGIMNLNTFELEGYSRDKFTTLYIDTEYKEVSEEEYLNSDFYKYLTSTFGGDAELIDQALEVLGMCLNPNPKQFQKAIVLEGEGSNGKSVFIEICQALIGSNFSTVSFKDIDGHKYANANMLGCTVNIDADASGDRLEDTSNFKKITAGDYITIEPKGKGLITTVLDILLILAVNKMPTSKDRSKGFERRWNIIPFESTFVNEEYEVDEKKRRYLKDKELTYRIITNELHIVFYKAIQALARLKRTRYTMTTSKAVNEATERYSKQNNTVKAFVLDGKEGKNYYEKISASVLYAIYQNWCDANEEVPVTKKTFGVEMSKHYEKKRTSGAIMYIGVTLHHDSDWLKNKNK